MPKQTKSSKKRMSNTRLKDRRQKCWTRGETRKQERRKEQDKRAHKNRELRASGKQTLWQMAKARRYALRHP